MNPKIVPVDIVESALDGVSSGTELVTLVAGNRTAVFVGNLASGEDAAAAREMAAELFPQGQVTE